MSDINLGQTPSELAQRDAIHVAVVPCVAAHELRPADRVGLYRNLACTEAQVSDITIIGVVDPYLTRNIRQGERFWLFLLPNTVTGMRHHWSHPLFPDPIGRVCCTREESEQWLRNFVERSDFPSFETMIAIATEQPIRSVDPEYYGTYINNGDYIVIYGRDAGGEIPDEFWDHIENYTGYRNPNRAKYFSCSC